MHFVQSLFSALDWAVTEVAVCLRAAAARRSGSAPSSSQKRRLLVFFSIAVTCTQLVEFLVSNVPELFLEGPAVLADRLAEMLAFLIVHAPVDAASDDFRALMSAAHSVDRASSRFLHPLKLARPIVAMLASLWTREASAREAAADGDAEEPTGGAPATMNSVIDRLCDMAAACPNQYLAALPDALLRHQGGGSAADGDAGESQHSSVRQQCAAVSALVEDFVVRRAAAGGAGGDDADDDVPPDYIDPITMAVMTDPVRLPDSGIVLDRGTAERHLQESGTDPYSREPLAREDLEEQPELRDKIAQWKAERAAAAQEAAAARVSGGSGAGEAACGGDARAHVRMVDAKAAADTIRSHVPENWDLDSEGEDADAPHVAVGRMREE